MVTSSRLAILALAAATFGVATLARAPLAAAQATSASKPASIDRNGVLILVRSTLLALDAANKTGNYTTFRDMSAPGFATANNASRLGEIFAGDRRDKIDLSGVAVLEPQLTRLPEIGSNGMMRMSGFFPSVPKQVNFDLLYQPVDQAWRLYGIAVNVGPSGPVAPQAALPPPPAEAAKPPVTQAAKASPTKKAKSEAQKGRRAAEPGEPSKDGE